MITDNTAKWKLKKVTNFTDKSAEIATQAQAEEGTDNTKMMTPKGVNYRLNKDRQRSSYIGLSQVGLSYQNTIEEICEGLPNNSTLTFFASAVTTSSNYLPNSPVPVGGMVTIIKSANATIPICLTLTEQYGSEAIYFGRYTNGDNRGFSGWKKIMDASNIATQSQAESGTDNTTVMTPLRTKQLGDKNYLKLSGGTLTDGIRIKGAYALVNAQNDEYFRIMGDPGGAGAWISLAPNAHPISSGEFKLIAANSLYASKVLWGSPNGTLTWNNKKVATQGALSMPVVDNEISVDKATTSYTAPTDGWLCVRAVGVASATNILTLAVNTNRMLHRHIWTTNNTQGLVMPMPKGAICSIELTSCSISEIYFVPAQSEV